jgi:hypothetical protein
LETGALSEGDRSLRGALQAIVRIRAQALFPCSGEEEQPVRACNRNSAAGGAPNGVQQPAITAQANRQRTSRRCSKTLGGAPLLEWCTGLD